VIERVTFVVCDAPNCQERLETSEQAGAARAEAHKEGWTRRRGIVGQAMYDYCPRCGLANPTETK